MSLLKEDTMLSQREDTMVSDIVQTVKDLPIMKEEDKKFLQEHADHLNKVMEKSYMWRTDMQKRHILNDFHFPTLHSKFHQAILEQKVQFDQSMYLVKEFELKKLEFETLEADLEDLQGKTSKRDGIERRRLELELKFKQYELKQCQIAMKYRMEEVKGWQQIEEGLLSELRAAGLGEEEIWSKNDGELSAMFFHSLNNLSAINATTDSAERSNLLAAAAFAVSSVRQAGKLEAFTSKCNQLQENSLKAILPLLK